MVGRYEMRVVTARMEASRGGNVEVYPRMIDDEEDDEKC
jgi:hypothetical protein